MNKVLMHDFIRLISAHTGLHIREPDQEDLCTKIYARMKLLNFSLPEKYYQLLNDENHQSNSHRETLYQREWRELTLLLTTGETYFFRDQGQITLLKNRILPELIERKRKEVSSKGEANPSLRIWSAGCSTGEEPYSLAILTKELIPDYSQWNIRILGTDINPESIEKAKRGSYTAWSFRMVKPELQMRYFHQEQTSWEIDQQIRTMVSFDSINLLKSSFPSYALDIQGMDLILCRNVFIYFDFNTISTVLEKFYNTLRSGGYLMAGHAELQGQNLGQLQVKVFPESVVYQRGKENLGVACVQPAPFLQLSPVVAISTTTQTGVKDNNTVQKSGRTRENLNETKFQTVLIRAETLFHKGDYALAIKEAEQVIQQDPQHFGAYYLIAQALANLGKYEQAIYYCQQALQVDSLSVTPYYILVHIAEEQGNIEKAKDLLKKIIYLIPKSIPAYLKLSAVYECEGDSTRAKKMLKTGFELLEKLPSHVFIEQHEMLRGRQGP